jgi:hypothetical protein
MKIIFYTHFITPSPFFNMNSAIVQLNDPHSLGGWFAPFTNRQYCAWFYWLMVVSGLALVFHVFWALYKIIESGGKLYSLTTPVFWSMIALNCLNYFTNRLLYTMCLNSV